MTIENISTQIRAIKIARARLDAEIAVAEAILPDDCASELHYNGYQRAMEKYPEYAQLIKTIKESEGA